MDELDIPLPSADDLKDEIASIRRKGVTLLSSVDVPALELAARASGRVGVREPVGSYVIERLLRDAAAGVGGDDSSLVATVLGLSEETRGGRPDNLRDLAAEEATVSREHFRKAREPELFRGLADRVLADIHDHRLRLRRLRMDVNTPQGSRMAVEWLKIFGALNRMWTDLSGVGAELTGYRSTMLETDRPWDLPPDPNIPGDKGRTQEMQAAGYVTDALAFHAQFLASLEDFKLLYGGQWLMPTVAAEDAASDAVYRATLATPNNNRDDSFLRGLLARVPGREIDGFLTELSRSQRGQALHREWQEWASTCRCTWEHGDRVGREHFPTHITHLGVDQHCDVHTLIEACNDYMLTVDDAWDQIADWYHPGALPERRQITAEEIMARRLSPLPRHLQPDDR